MVAQKRNIVEMIEEKDSFTVIYGFMTRNLGLSGAELIAYAKIYGFTRQGKCFYGSLKYLSGVMGASRMTASRALKNLEERGLIARIEGEDDSSVRIYIADLKQLASLLKDSDFTEESQENMIEKSLMENEVYSSNKDYIVPDVGNDDHNYDGDAQNVTHRANSTQNLKKFSTVEKIVPAVKPTYDEIREYCEKQGLAVDVNKFYMRYERQGWMSGGKPVSSWKNLLHGWMCNASRFAEGFTGRKKERKIYETPLAENRDDSNSPYRAFRDSASMSEEEAERIIREMESA